MPRRVWEYYILTRQGLFKKERNMNLKPLLDDEPIGIHCWLTSKKERDPMKKTIAKVQREIEAKANLLDEVSAEGRRLRQEYDDSYRKVKRLVYEIRQLGECLVTLETFQEKN